MTAPFVDVVIACHDESRPIERAVRSVLQDADVRDAVRVTVVAHGLPAEPFESRLAGMDGSWRVLSFSDGVRSAAGPFNHGLAITDAEYCAVMGSDDFLEPGALSAWVGHARSEMPDALMARIRIDGFPAMPNPLSRLGRSRRLDAARDRLFYRTAPLGLIRTATMRAMGLRMMEGVRVGEDFEFGIRLFSLSHRVDFARTAPCYVIGTDARERTTLAPLSAEEALEPIERLLDDGVPGELSRSHRRALAIKLVRISIVGNTRSRALPEQWRGDDETAFVASLLRRLLALAPGVLAPFSLQDRGVLDALLNGASVAEVTAAVARAAGAGRVRRWFTRNPLHSFDRESMLRRYVLYLLKRERKSRWP